MAISLRYRLDRLPEQELLITREPPEQDPAFAKTTVTRRVRDTPLSRQLKAIYGNHCQVCNTAILGYEGRTFSEGAHVRPLGRPHLGGDTQDNLLCLCPNHHTQLDFGGIVILEDMAVAQTDTLIPFTELTFRGPHRLAAKNAAYHQQMWMQPLRANAAVRP